MLVWYYATLDIEPLRQKIGNNNYVNLALFEINPVRGSWSIADISVYTNPIDAIPWYNCSTDLYLLNISKYDYDARKSIYVNCCLQILQQLNIEQFIIEFNCYLALHAARRWENFLPEAFMEYLVKQDEAARKESLRLIDNMSFDHPLHKHRAVFSAIQSPISNGTIREYISMLRVEGDFEQPERVRKTFYRQVEKLFDLETIRKQNIECEIAV